VNIRIGHSDWSKSSAYGPLFAELSGYKSLATKLTTPLPFWQANKADSCLPVKSHVFDRYRSRSCIIESMRIFKMSAVQLDPKCFQKLVNKPYVFFALEPLTG